MGAMIWSGVRERVETLARADNARDDFGAWDMHGGTGHHFRLADPLSEASVAEAEAQWGVSLPADYRAFLREVGAGGAGAFFEESVCAQVEHERKEPVESHFEDEAAFDAAYRAWLREDEKLSDRFLSGAVCLSHEGCGYFHWLVVSGPQRGQVWLDERPGDGGFSPLGQVGFANWYLDWVEKTEAVVRGGR
ncbi:SMI1/KNR4 family protein [Streptomyces sp. NPDC093568]|uniref:SMI1/KNR4 family protein n=1 Tax=Streptomyces sp. NPDC093568 TaxID=3366041 RepID=UPI003812FCF1